MTAGEAYAWLIEASSGSSCDAFDIHVFASILALALEEVSGGRRLSDGTGLAPEALASGADDMFPGAATALRELSRGGSPFVDEEEQSVRDILMMYATGASDLERPLAAMIARRCTWPHHLWQDLGLRDRGELSALMKRHFAPLAAKNRNDMKWKKFLYRMVCGSEGFTLCTSPVCSECDDFANCFGAEDGESLLARTRNARGAAA